MLPADTLRSRMFHLYDNNVDEIFITKENLVLKGYMSIDEFEEKFPVSFKGRSVSTGRRQRPTLEYMALKNKNAKGKIQTLYLNFKNGKIADVYFD